MSTDAGDVSDSDARRIVLIDRSEEVGDHLADFPARASTR